MQSPQAISAIERRSYQGDAEALRALLYNVADDLYAAALAASADEATAMDLAQAAWRRWLENVGRWRCRSDLVGWLRLALWDEIATRAQPELAEVALALWQSEPEKPVGLAPTVLVERLEQDLAAALPSIRRRASVRRKFFWGTMVFITGLVAALVLIGVEIAAQVATSQTRQVAWETLQARVQEAHLDWNLRDVLFDLADPQGTDRFAAQVISQAVLVLEEIAESPSRPGRQSLNYIRERLAGGELLQRLRELAVESPGHEHRTLMQATLALEEAQSL